MELLMVPTDFRDQMLALPHVPGVRTEPHDDGSILIEHAGGRQVSVPADLGPHDECSDLTVLLLSLSRATGRVTITSLPNGIGAHWKVMYCPDGWMTQQMGLGVSIASALLQALMNAWHPRSAL